MAIVRKVADTYPDPQSPGNTIPAPEGVARVVSSNDTDRATVQVCVYRDAAAAAANAPVVDSSSHSVSGADYVTFFSSAALSPGGVTQFTQAQAYILAPALDDGSAGPYADDWEAKP